MDVLAVAVPRHPCKPDGPADICGKGCSERAVDEMPVDHPSEEVRRDRPVEPIGGILDVGSVGEREPESLRLRIVGGHDLQERRVVGRVEEPIGFVDQIEAAVRRDPSRRELHLRGVRKT